MPDVTRQHQGKVKSKQGNTRLFLPELAMSTTDTFQWSYLSDEVIFFDVRVVPAMRVHAWVPVMRMHA